MATGPHTPPRWRIGRVPIRLPIRALASQASKDFPKIAAYRPIRTNGPIIVPRDKARSNALQDGMKVFAAQLSSRYPMG